MAEEFDDVEDFEPVEITLMDEVESEDFPAVADGSHGDSQGDSQDDSQDDPADDVMVLEEIDNSLRLPVWEPTGEPRVDAALDLLTLLDVDDVSGHAEVFVEVHDRLRATLVDLDGR